MDKKDFENLSESELRELKESIDEVLEEKKYKESYLKTNPKGVAIAWVVVAVIISVYRYLTCLLYTSPSPRDPKSSRMPSSA